MRISLKRVYEPAEQDDGVRILVDRLWPRGVTKANAAIDIWAKEVTPSTELRVWYGHDPKKWPEFQQKYRDELKGNPALEEIRDLSRQGKVTLVYAAKDELHAHVLVLQQVLEQGS